jgi:hypothetical protein
MIFSLFLKKVIINGEYYEEIVQERNRKTDGNQPK